MKVAISDYACISVDAPVLPAYEVNNDGIVHWRSGADTARSGTGAEPRKDTGRRTAKTPQARIGGRCTIWRTLGDGAHDPLLARS